MVTKTFLIRNKIFYSIDFKIGRGYWFFGSKQYWQDTFSKIVKLVCTLFCILSLLCFTIFFCGMWYCYCFPILQSQWYVNFLLNSIFRLNSNAYDYVHIVFYEVPLVLWWGYKGKKQNNSNTKKFYQTCFWGKKITKMCENLLSKQIYRFNRHFLLFPSKSNNHLATIWTQ